MESVEEPVTQSNPMDASEAPEEESKPLAQRDEENSSDRQKLAALLGLGANSEDTGKPAKLAGSASPEHASKTGEQSAAGQGQGAEGEQKENIFEGSVAEPKLEISEHELGSGSTNSNSS